MYRRARGLDRDVLGWHVPILFDLLFPPWQQCVLLIPSRDHGTEEACKTTTSVLERLPKSHQRVTAELREPSRNSTPLWERERESIPKSEDATTGRFRPTTREAWAIKPKSGWSEKRPSPASRRSRYGSMKVPESSLAHGDPSPTSWDR
jgi:hypothetical protein